jgi:hypothetical protein
LKEAISEIGRLIIESSRLEVGDFVEADCAGDSVATTKMTARLSRIWAINLPLQILFRYNAGAFVDYIESTLLDEIFYLGKTAVKLN